MSESLPPARWPTGDGEMASLMRDRDWSQTPLGPTENWTQSLRTTVDIMLRAAAEIVLFCGPEFVALYNDAYAPTIGDKHPRALGRPASENWSELWDDLEPLLRGVLQTGETFSAKDRPFYIERDRGQGETVYFDVSYSAVRRHDGTVEAVLCIVSETTGRVLAASKVRESEQRFRALVNASSDVVYRMSPDWQEMHRLDGRAFLPNVDNAPVKWRDAYLFPEDQAAVGAAIDDAVEKRSIFELEHRVRRADGTEGWIASRAIPILDQDGFVTEWFGMAADITAKKASEQHILMLLREVNHRVKNQFAVVMSMIRETSKRTSDPRQFERHILERIMALSRSHDLLVSTDWNGAGIVDLVEEHLKPFGRESRVSLSGPMLTLQPNAVQNIGMALHELGTNSAKYGALSGDDGWVSVTWRLCASPEGPSFELNWQEKIGQPAAAVQPEPREGFGSIVLRRVAPMSLSGQAILERTPDFVRWTLMAPIATVVADPGLPVKIDATESGAAQEPPPAAPEADVAMKRPVSTGS